VALKNIENIIFSIKILLKSRKIQKKTMSFFFQNSFDNNHSHGNESH